MTSAAHKAPRLLADGGACPASKGPNQTAWINGKWKMSNTLHGRVDRVRGEEQSEASMVSSTHDDQCILRMCKRVLTSYVRSRRGGEWR